MNAGKFITETGRFIQVGPTLDLASGRTLLTLEQAPQGTASRYEVRLTDGEKERLAQLLVPRRISKVFVNQLQILRQKRKAALRECGRLGEKLHTARLEIEVQRHRIKELEAKLLAAGAYKEEGQ